MLTDPLEIWSAQDEANYDFIKLKYKNREELGEQWIEKRKTAEKNKHTAEGKPNPHYPRMALEADMCRLMFENAYMLAKLEQMQCQIDIMNTLHQRLTVVEAGYVSFALATQTVKVDYHNRLKAYLENNNPEIRPERPPRPRSVGEIVDQDYLTQSITEK